MTVPAAATRLGRGLRCLWCLAARKGKRKIGRKGLGFRRGARLIMNTIALLDATLEIPGESIGKIISTHDTIAAAFKANEAFQSRMRASGIKSHIRTKIVTLKVPLGDGEHVKPSLHLA